MGDGGLKNFPVCAQSHAESTGIYLIWGFNKIMRLVRPYL